MPRPFATIAALLVLHACGGTTTPTGTDDDPSDPDPPVATALDASPASVSLSSLGETSQLTAAVSDQNGAPIAGAPITWASSSSGVASVDAAGLVTAVASGTAEVTATSGAVADTVAVDVTQVPAVVEVSPPGVVLAAAGESAALVATVGDAGGSEIVGAAVSWASNDEGVAIVDASGVVTAVAMGMTEITATSGPVSASADVTVGGPATVDTLLPVPMTAMDGVTYKGFEGGLYPGGDEPPAAHLQAAMDAAAGIEPLDEVGQPDANGSIVLLSIGMSNATQEFCSATTLYPCDAWTFVGQATADVDVDQTNLRIVNGAMGGQQAAAWTSPTHANYDRIRDDHLAPNLLSEAQVQAVWVKTATAVPSVALPESNADAYELEGLLGEIGRALLTRYPNLEMVFISSRIYAGWASNNLSPEPYAYESGYATRFVIEAQITQEATGTEDAISGDLAIGTAAPWIGWGPYIWAEGENPNPDGLSYVESDFESDGTHPARGAEEKVADALMSFFKTAPYTTPWFLD